MNGVYKLSCNNCSAIYIGETGRQIGIRVKEHTHKNGTSAFSQHLKFNNHTLNTSSGIKILHQLAKSQKMILLETYEIKKAKNKNQNILNEQLDINFTPIHEYI